MSSRMGIITGVLDDYAASVGGIHIHPLRLTNWVALKGYQVTDARLSYCLKCASRPKKKPFGRTTEWTCGSSQHSVAVYATQGACLDIPLLVRHRQVAVVAICSILNAAQLIRAREAQRLPWRKPGRLRRSRNSDWPNGIDNPREPPKVAGRVQNWQGVSGLGAPTHSNPSGTETIPCPASICVKRKKEDGTVPGEVESS